MIMFSDMEAAGFIPTFLDERDPRPAVEQIHTAYAHGGGWFDFNGFTLESDKDSRYLLLYPEDPPVKEVSRAKLRDETLVLFQHSWFAVIQPDNSFRVCRLD